MYDLPPLNRIRAFEASARLRSFKRAAVEIGISASAISHRIRLLESELGSPLFRRTGSGVVPTAVGEAFRQTVTQALQDIENAWQREKEEASSTSIRISCAPIFAARHLFPTLGEFRDRQKPTPIDLQITNNISDLDADESDFAIRMSRRPEQGMWSELLCTVRIVVIGHPSIRESAFSAGVINGPLLGITYQQNGWPDYIESTNLQLAEGAQTLWFDSLEAVASAARAGAGIGLVPDWYATDLKISHGLEIMSNAPLSTEFAYWLLARKGEASSPRLNAVRHWVRNGLMRSGILPGK